MTEGRKIASSETAEVHVFRVVSILDYFVIYIECVIARFNCISFNGYDALDKVSIVVWWNKNENIPTCRFMEIENFDVCAGDFDTIAKLAHQNLVSNEEYILHGSR